MFIDKLKLKEQIRKGDVQEELLIALQLFDHFLGTTAIETIRKRLQIKELQQGEILSDKGNIYIVLFGQVGRYLAGDSFTLESQLLAKQRTDLVFINERLYNYLLNENHNHALRDLTNIISQIPMFRRFNYQAMTNFCSRGQQKSIHEGKYLHHQGEMPKSGYIVIKGSFGTDRQIKFRKRDPICIYQCLNQQPLGYSIFAKQECTYFQVDRKVLLEFELMMEVHKEPVPNPLPDMRNWYAFRKRIISEILER